MYSSAPMDGVGASEPVRVSASFATCAPAKAKKRKRNVPRNSPMACNGSVLWRMTNPLGEVGATYRDGMAADRIW
jgi:hypothetical protein